MKPNTLQRVRRTAGLSIVLAAAVLAGQPSRTLAEEATAPTSAPANEMPWLIPHTGYQGDLSQRPAMTGDWGGTRQTLMDNGVRLDASSTFVLQGNWAGGRDNRTGTTGGLDLGVQVDTGKADLWPGGIIKLKAEGRVGDGSNTTTGALMPVNTDSLYPAPGDDQFLVSELNVTQFLSPHIAFTLGKFSLREANVFAHDETEQFLNTAFNFNPVASTTIPLSALGAGVILLPTSDFLIATMVLDSEGTAEESGFDTAFERGTTVMQTYQLTVKPWGLTGHQRISWTYSDRSRTQFTQNPREILSSIITGSTAGLEREGSDWSVFYDFDQYLFSVPGSKDRGWGIFGRVGFGNSSVNLTQSFYSIGIGGKGPLDARPHDSFGIGLYYLQISDDLPIIFANRARDEYGVEMYYSFAVTPWLHVTPDIQILEPASRDVDTTVVAGLRVKLVF